MAELTIRPEEIRDALERFVEAYEPGTAATEEVGAHAPRHCLLTWNFSWQT